MAKWTESITVAMMAHKNKLVYNLYDITKFYYYWSLTAINMFFCYNKVQLTERSYGSQ